MKIKFLRTIKNLTQEKIVSNKNIKHFFELKKGDKLSPLTQDFVNSSLVKHSKLQKKLENATQKLLKNRIIPNENYSQALQKAITRDIGDDLDVLTRRIDTINSCNKNQREMLCAIALLENKENKNTSFFIDNFKEISKIFNKKQISSSNSFTSQKDILEALTKENYPIFIELAKNIFFGFII